MSKMYQVPVGQWFEYAGEKYKMHALTRQRRPGVGVVNIVVAVKTDGSRAKFMRSIAEEVILLPKGVNYGKQ